MSIRSSGRPALVAVLAGTLLLGPNLPSRAEQAPRVAVVGPIDSYGALVAGVSEGLQSAGFADASRIRVDVRNARSADEAKAAVGGAVDAGVDAIVTIFGPSTQAARTATTRVPVADPGAAKLVASNEAPGGNLTGVASADAEASRRRLAAFRQVLPELKRLAVFFDPGFPPDRVQLANLEQVASSSGLTLVMRAVGDANAAVAALRGLGRADADAVFVLKEALLRRAAPEPAGTREDLRPDDGQDPAGRQAGRPLGRAPGLRTAGQSQIRGKPRRRRAREGAREGRRGAALVHLT